MYHDFFIHSSVNELLGGFHVLAIINSATMNIGVPVSFRIVVFSGYMPSSGTAGSHGGFIPSVFKESPYCSPSLLHQLPIPTSSTRGPFFPHPLQHPLQDLLFIDFLMISILTSGEVKPQYNSDFHFSNNEQC